MNAKTFAEAMNRIGDNYILEALHYKKKKTSGARIRWYGLAACACVIAAIGAVTVFNNAGTRKPNPQMVQVANPLIEVSSAEEMKGYLDFTVPVLDKEVQNYIVIVMDNYPSIGQIDYADGSEYRIQYGSGDISGIYGGIVTDTRQVEQVEVTYYTFDNVGTEVTYATWEQGGYTFSYIYTGDGENEIQQLIERFGAV